MEKHSVLFQTKQHVNSNHSRPTDCSIGGCEGYNRPPQEAFLSRWLPGCAGWGGNPSCPFFCHPVITQLLHGGQLTAVHPLICTETVPQLVLNVGGEGLEGDFGGRKFMDVLNHFWKRKKKRNVCDCSRGVWIFPGSHGWRIEIWTELLQLLLP